jgi:hypothetical protein
MTKNKSPPNPSLKEVLSVDITPEVAIYDVFRHLNYKPWYAMGEFVDNSLQSFLNNKASLAKQKVRVVKVEIDIEPGGQKVTVRDNAAGIAARDYERAFKTGTPPKDNAGLNQFGMGMKTAANWFARKWTVTSAALGESVVRELTFNVEEVVRGKKTSIGYEERPKPANDHYTVVELVGLNSPLHHHKTVNKVRDHLGSIYRQFIRDGDLELWFNGTLVEPDEPEVLRATRHSDPNGEEVEWRKPIDIPLKGGGRVHGEVYLLETGSTTNAGLALLRHRRLVQGSGDERYRPQRVFGNPNSFVYQRLAGELTVEGLEITHTKDGFRWEEHEEEFLDALAEQIDAEPMNLREQAQQHRKRPKRVELQPDAEKALDSTARVLEKYAQEVIASHLDAPREKESKKAEPPQHLEEAKAVAQREVQLTFDGVQWTVTLEMSVDPAIKDWYSISQRASGTGAKRHIGVRVLLDHPFVNQFSLPGNEHIEPMLRIAIALALAETTARQAGVKDPGEVRIIVNDLLRKALWQPKVA